MAGVTEAHTSWKARVIERIEVVVPILSEFWLSLPKLTGEAHGCVQRSMEDAIIETLVNP
jgi:hypothetical protein